MWRAVSRSLDITPSHELHLGGFAIRTKPFTGIAGRLEANLLLLEGDEQRLLIVSIDALFVGPELRPAILAAAGAELNPDQLLICASHTHYAPAIDSTKPILGPVNRAYLDGLKASLAEVVSELLQADREAVYLTVSEGRADHHVNRRRMGWHISVRGPARCQRAPDPDGPRDERIRRVDLRAESDDRLVSVLWHYACHPTGYPDMRQVSPDFPGAVREGLRDRMEANIPVLFLQGCSGDLRPRCLDASPRLFRVLLRLVNGPQFGLFTSESWKSWCDGIVDALEACESKGAPDHTGRLRVQRCEEALDRVVEGKADAQVVSWHGVELGDALKCLAVSAELVVDYGLELPEDMIAVGCAEHVFGYYPTDEMLPQGGYEVQHFQGDFGLEVKFKPGLRAWFTEKVNALFSASS